MANRNTNPGIGESTDSGVMHNPDATRARTHARVVRLTGILTYHTRVRTSMHAHTRVRARVSTSPLGE